MRNGGWRRRVAVALVAAITLCPLALSAQRRNASALPTSALVREPAAASHSSMLSAGWTSTADADNAMAVSLLAPNWRVARPENPGRGDESRRRKHAKIGALICGVIGAGIGALVP
jgi:hypothetical protein